MGDGQVQDIDPVLAQELAIVGGPQSHAGHALEPRERLRVGVAHGNELGGDRVIGQRRPAAERGGQLAAHHAAADQAHPDALAHAASSAAALCAGAPSCTTARRARTIAAGRSCWITLRP